MMTLESMTLTLKPVVADELRRRAELAGHSVEQEAELILDAAAARTNGAVARARAEAISAELLALSGGREYADSAPMIRAARDA